MNAGRRNLLTFFDSIRIPILTWAFLFLGPCMVWAVPPRYDEAVEKYRQGDAEGALAIVRAVFDENRGSLELRMLAAACYRRLNNLDSAMAHALYAMKDHPDESGPAIYLAVLHREKEDFPRAAEILKRTAGRFPQDPWVRFELASTYFLQKNYAPARQQIEAVLAKNPNFFPAVYLDGLIYLAEGSYENADFRFRNAARIRMTDKEWTKRLYNNMGLVNERLASQAVDQKTREEKIALAREYFRKAQDLDGGYAIARANLERVR